MLDVAVPGYGGRLPIQASLTATFSERIGIFVACVIVVLIFWICAGLCSIAGSFVGWKIPWYPNFMPSGTYPSGT